MDRATLAAKILFDSFPVMEGPYFNPLAFIEFAHIWESIIEAYTKGMRTYQQAGPWAEMLDTQNNINWI